MTAAALTAALTAREREVALLAAADTRSKDIADGLQLSVRTVNNHLQHAYAELGVTTRRELATALHRRVQADAGPLTELLISDTAQPSGSMTSA
ncbi:helix-turn-helix transcriptional regulator [Streptomyces sp. NBC_00191]|uniref:response regulator transcription factor n=1 Tax=Streptomyces sp. NBC_00191 TaxID=2975674 RepID=UPI0032503A24